MRFRSKGNYPGMERDWTETNIRRSDNKVMSHHTGVHYGPTGRREVMIDDDTKRSGKNRRSRYCDHIIGEYVNTPMIGRYQTSSTNDHQFYYPGGSSRARIWAGEAISHPGIPSNTHNDALVFFAAGCQTRELSLANFLLELRELPKLLTPVKWRELRSAYAKIKHKVLSAQQAAKVAGRNVGNAHLWYQFGVKPLVGDTKRIISAIQTLDQRVDWLMRNANQPVRVQFGATIAPEADWGSFSKVGEDAIREMFLRERSTSSYRANAVIVYELGSARRAAVELKLKLRAYGFDAPLGIVWEAIPYSFVVDWLLGVQDVLDRLVNISFPVRFIDVCYAQRTYQEAEFYTRLKYGTKPTIGSGTAFKSRYTRFPGLPASLSLLPETGSPGLRQLGLAAALYAQKR